MNTATFILVLGALALDVLILYRQRKKPDVTAIKYAQVRGALERGNIKQARIWAGLPPRPLSDADIKAAVDWATDQEIERRRTR